MSIKDMLSSLSNYPINRVVIERVCLECELNIDDDANSEIIKSDKYKRATAKIFIYLSTAPNVGQGGQSYSLTEYERRDYKNKGLSILKKLNDNSEDNILNTSKYGYKGGLL